VAQIQEAIIRATAIASLVPLLESAPGASTQPAAALLLYAACVGSPLGAARALQDGAVAPLVSPTKTHSPTHKSDKRKTCSKISFNTVKTVKICAKRIVLKQGSSVVCNL
jgi:hypothetical protein